MPAVATIAVDQTDDTSSVDHENDDDHSHATAEDDCVDHHDDDDDDDDDNYDSDEYWSDDDHPADQADRKWAATVDGVELHSDQDIAAASDDVAAHYVAIVKPLRHRVRILATYWQLLHAHVPVACPAALSVTRRRRPARRVSSLTSSNTTTPRVQPAAARRPLGAVGGRLRLPLGSLGTGSAQSPQSTSQSSSRTDSNAVSDAKQAAMIAMLSARPGASSEAIIAESLNFAAAAQIQKGQARPKWNPTVKKVRPKEAYTAMQMPGLFEGTRTSAQAALPPQLAALFMNAAKGAATTVGTELVEAKPVPVSEKLRSFLARPARSSLSKASPLHMTPTNGTPRREMSTSSQPRVSSLGDAARSGSQESTPRSTVSASSGLDLAHSFESLPTARPVMVSDKLKEGLRSRRVPVVSSGPMSPDPSSPSLGAMSPVSTYPFSLADDTGLQSSATRVADVAVAPPSVDTVRSAPVRVNEKLKSFLARSNRSPASAASGAIASSNDAQHQQDGAR
jgi:hypothetical protein